MVNTTLRAAAVCLILAAGLSPAWAWQKSGSFQPSAPPPKPETRPAPPKPAPPAAAPAAPKAPADRGDFKVVYAPVKDASYKELQQIFKETQLFEETVKALNETLILPSDVAVTLRECGEINAFYEPDAKRISMCYELVGYFAEMFLADAETEEDAETAGVAVAGATLFIFFHEAGHALIDLFDLPVTGKEEDAVDQLATLILLEAGPEGEDAALDAASSFLTEDEEISEEEMAFWDEHSLDEQRFYNVICWIYGKSPKDFQDLVEDGSLPAERAERCPAEYEKMSGAWDTLLAPYVKE